MNQLAQDIIATVEAMHDAQAPESEIVDELYNMATFALREAAKEPPAPKVGTVAVSYEDLKDLLDGELLRGVPYNQMARHRRMTVALTEQTPQGRYENYGRNKIACIKVVKRGLNLDLKEAKDWVEGGPHAGVPLALLRALQEAGAEVS